MNDNLKHKITDVGILLRFVTPMLVTVAIVILTNISMRVSAIDQKMFAHLTNADIHIPREQIVPKAVFDTYSKFAEKNFALISTALEKVKSDLIVEMKRSMNEDYKR